MTFNLISRLASAVGFRRRDQWGELTPLSSLNGGFRSIDPDTIRQHGVVIGMAWSREDGCQPVYAADYQTVDPHEEDPAEPLTAEDIATLAEYLTDYSDLEFSAAQARELLDADPELERMLEQFGFCDTANCDMIRDMLTQFLIGRDWPQYGEHADMAEFSAKMTAAGIARGFKPVEAEQGA